MIIIIVMGSFLLLSLFIYLILQKTVAKKLRIKSRLEEVSNNQEYNEVSERKKKSFYEKLIKENSEKIGNKLAAITPKRYVDELDKKLHRAGIYPKVSREKWMFMKFMASFLLMVAILTLVIMYFDYGVSTLIVVAVSVLIIINILNYLTLSNKITTRKREIQKELPDTIDLITVSVEAGLSFDSAVSRFANTTDSDLSDEFKIMLKEINLGVNRKRALKNIIDRCDVDDLSAFIGSIIQANELGVSITNLLRVQSKIIREKRKQRAREKSMKAPIKLLFPLLFFIFPLIFVIILGPTVIKLMSM